MEAKMAINSAIRQMEAKMAIESATVEKYSQKVTNSQAYGSKDGHTISNN